MDENIQQYCIDDDIKNLTMNIDLITELNIEQYIQLCCEYNSYNSLMILIDLNKDENDYQLYFTLCCKNEKFETFETYTQKFRLVDTNY